MAETLITRYLGVDWGEARIGLAVADSETKIATPLGVARSMEDVLQTIRDEEIDVIILGKPASITNYELRITNERYNKFVNDLKHKVEVPLKLVDERLSSKAADALVGSKKTKAPRDAVAAMIILQSYLDRMGKE